MYFTIIGNEGFAISDNFGDFAGLIEKGMINDIYVNSFRDVEQAYVADCKLYVERAYKQRGFYPPLPKLDELIQHGGLYLAPTYQKLETVITAKRYFGVLTEQGYLSSDNFADIVEFVRLYCRWHCEVFESPDKSWLLEAIQKKYMLQRMAMSAYITDPLMMPQKIDIGEAFVDYNLKRSMGLDSYQKLLLDCYSQLNQ